LWPISASAQPHFRCPLSSSSVRQCIGGSHVGHLIDGTAPDSSPFAIKIPVRSYPSPANPSSYFPSAATHFSLPQAAPLLASLATLRIHARQRVPAWFARPPACSSTCVFDPSPTLSVHVSSPAARTSRRPSLCFPRTRACSLSAGASPPPVRHREQQPDLLRSPAAFSVYSPHRPRASAGTLARRPRRLDPELRRPLLCSSASATCSVMRYPSKKGVSLHLQHPHLEQVVRSSVLDPVDPVFEFLARHKANLFIPFLFRSGRQLDLSQPCLRRSASA
jgi:hypothetical protein